MSTDPVVQMRTHGFAVRGSWNKITVWIPTVSEYITTNSSTPRHILPNYYSSIKIYLLFYLTMVYVTYGKKGCAKTISLWPILISATFTEEMADRAWIKKRGFSCSRVRSRPETDRHSFLISFQLDAHQTRKTKTNRTRSRTRTNSRTINLNNWKSTTEPVTLPDLLLIFTLTTAMKRAG